MDDRYGSDVLAAGWRERAAKPVPQMMTASAVPARNSAIGGRPSSTSGVNRRARDRSANPTDSATSAAHSDAATRKLRLLGMILFPFFD